MLPRSQPCKLKPSRIRPASPSPTAWSQRASQTISSACFAKWPTPLPVLLTVVKHVATLTQGLQISQPIIGGIMVKVRSRQRHPGCANSYVVAHSSSKAGQSPSAPIAPGPVGLHPTIDHRLHAGSHGHAACRPLAPALGSLKPDHRRKLRPVDRIKPFVLGGGSASSFSKA